ncbi:MAG: zf-HC2 domain-containing protein [Ruminococcus sp.]|nr:zf-HC2 domain-containing protein [Ruminococcus sp.]
MKCEIIKDLIPLCEEGLCSPESEAEIREHIKTCESCRLLYEQIPAQGEIPLPEETEAMAKVSKRLRHGRLRTAVLGALLAGVLGGLGYLTYGQIAKPTGGKSFETVFQSLEVRKMAKKFTEGDLDYYMSKISLGGAHLTLDQFSYLDQYKAQDKEILKEAYSAAFGDTKVKDIDVSSSYGSLYAYAGSEGYSEGAPCACSDVTITFEDGRRLELSFAKDMDGLYDCLAGYRYGDTSISKEEADLENAFAYTSYHDLLPVGFFQRLLLARKATTEPYSKRFCEGYRSGAAAGAEAFRDAGYTMESVIMGTPTYDPDREMFRYDLCLTASDGKGKAVAVTKLWLTPKGLIPPDKEELTVAPLGCTEGLTAALESYFTG